MERSSDRCLRWSSILLGCVAWSSAALFGLFILAFYARAWLDGSMERWNEILPGLHDPERPAATIGIGVHFAAGGVILLLGALQLLEPVRRRAPAIHRWSGRIYATACMATAIGGLAFIAVKGTIGGTVMNVGFGLYGVLMLVASIETVRHARARRFEKHRAWGLRLFALAIGSWLYRMQYGFWLMLTDGLGHTNRFDGPFDHLMAFFFYLPNLLVVEIMLRSSTTSRPPLVAWTLAAILCLASGVLGLGTFYFVRSFWGPEILDAMRSLGA
jgi:uncharacterized membrane protein